MPEAHVKPKNNTSTWNCGCFEGADKIAREDSEMFPSEGHDIIPAEI